MAHINVLLKFKQFLFTFLMWPLEILLFYVSYNSHTSAGVEGKSETHREVKMSQTWCQFQKNTSNSFLQN